MSSPRAVRALGLVLAWVTAAALAAPLAAPLAAQPAPDAAWRTLHTPHFRVHFTPPLEAVARRAAGEAERAYARLAAELAPPRGIVDVVVADNRDVSNGQAQIFPTNRFVLWVRPPIDDAPLRFADDWIQQVVTHELAHVFHLDRSRGWWRAAQFVFGRHPALFPNAYQPRWIVEGIAVDYESRLSGGGRLNGTDLHTAVDAMRGAGRAVAPARLSIASPYWPGANSAYFGGGWLMAAADSAGGAGSVREFIERSASQPIPWMWDRAARRAFGASFDSLARGAAPSASWTGAGGVDTAAAGAGAGPYWELRAPRWRGDTVFYVASGPRDVTGLFAQHGGRVRRVDRRNSVDAFAFAGDAVVYADLEFRGPYRLYSALSVDGDRAPELGRLASPDVRRDGEIVAVDAAEGGARLVLARAGAQRVRELTARDQDVQWSAPRWSRAGDRVAAVRWRRGAESEIVVLDTAGRVLAAYATARAVQAYPSWDAGDAALYFTSDRSGRSAAYRVAIAGADSGNPRLVAEAPLGIAEVEASPDGRALAVVRDVESGYELDVLRVPGDLSRAPLAMPSVLAPAARDPVVSYTGPVRGYAAWRTLIPRYWVPTAATSDRNAHRLGFQTSAEDVVGRNRIFAELSWDIESGEMYGDAGWSFRGFGVPTIDVAASQSWDIFGIVDQQGAPVGEVTRRNRIAALTANWSLPGVRRGVALTTGVEYEWRDFETHPAALAAQLDPPPPGRLRYPAVVAAAGWSATRRSALAVSAEDGAALSVAVRRRWRTDLPDETLAHSVLARGRAYKSLPLPGHARHVVALHAALGWAEPQTTSLFSVGGVSGATHELFPGYFIGDAQRAFPVRGFAPGAADGVRAWGATAEYRAPLGRIGRGAWPLPVFAQRATAAAFVDAASAWCPRLTVASAACPANADERPVFASAGGELQLDATLDYDSPTRFRLGVAVPVHGARRAGARSASVYASLGLPF